MKVVMLKLERLRMDARTQARAETNQGIVEEYTEYILAGVQFPPIVVYFDGVSYWPADGWHRIKAHQGARQKTILADVRQGGERDAILFAVGANVNHGFRRSNEDKRRAVSMLLVDDEWSKWSAYKIAEQCGVSEGLVRILKTELSTYSAKIDPSKHRENCNSGLQIDHSPPATVKVSRGDSVYEMRVGNIGNRDGAKVEKRCPYCRQTITE